MKKILFSLILILGFFLAKSQQIDSTYNVDTVQFVPKFATAEPIQKFATIARTQLTFLTGGKVRINYKGNSTIYKIVSKEVDEETGDTYKIVFNALDDLDNPCMLALRFDAGKIYSMAVTVGKDMFIFIIKYERNAVYQ